MQCTVRITGHSRVRVKFLYILGYPNSLLFHSKYVAFNVAGNTTNVHRSSR